MLPLYLIAAHLVGDFVFQTRWQAAAKLTDRYARAAHVSTYLLAFVPVVVLEAEPEDRLRPGSLAGGRAMQPIGRSIP